MKKGINWIWRLVAVAVLLCALVPVAFSTSVEATSYPVTYLNPLPLYLNAATYTNLVYNAGISGTALAPAGQSINQVVIQISYTNGSDTYYWNGTESAFLLIQTTITSPAGLSGWSTRQYNFGTTSDLPQAGNLINNRTYYITAQALDNPNGDKDPTGSTRWFIYDNIKPVVGNLTSLGNANVSLLNNESRLPVASTIADNSIRGTCGDFAPGKVANVQVTIQNTSSGDYWDGMAWANISDVGPLALLTASFSGTTWTLSGLSSVAWTDYTNYLLEVRAIDQAGNPSDWRHQNFLYAKSFPTSANPGIIVDTLPANFSISSPCWNEMITGTTNASVNKSVNVTAVSIRDTTRGGVWDGSTFNTANDPTPIWHLATAINGYFNTSRQVDWYFDASGIWTPGDTYAISVLAIQNATCDGSSNWAGLVGWNLSKAQTLVSGVYTITCDDARPVVPTILIPGILSTSPLPGPVVVNSLTSISGTCTDTLDEITTDQPKEVVVFIIDNTTKALWSGFAWVQDETIGWPVAAGTSNWVIDTSTVPWEHMHHYIIEALCLDKAGNIGVFEGEAQFIFVQDLTSAAPITTTETINTTIDNISSYVTSLTAITGTANATYGVITGVRVQLRDTTNDSYWSGSDWIANATPLVALPADGYWTTAAENWTINTTTTPALPTFTTGHKYSVQAQAYYGATNGTVATASFTFGPAPTATPTPTPTATATPTPTPTPTAAPITTSAVTPSSGSIDGGTNITITGTGFASGATVTIDGIAATDVHVVSATTITAITPKGTAGAKDVVVTNHGSSKTLAGAFTYKSSWAWYYWLLIGIGAVIVILAIVLLVVLPKRRDQGDVPPDSLVDDQF